MSINLNIDNYGGRSIVPVRCGYYMSGTAFFVSPTRLLTAGHVLAEYRLDKGTTVAIKVGGDEKFCRVIEDSTTPDVAVLECVDYACPNEYILPLLVSKFRKDIEAMVIGYPRELGNGEDFYGVTVRNSRKKNNLKGGYDCMVVRTDSFGFYSYDGFSGAPVINEFGMVMGIETDQLYNTLGYVSTGAFKALVEKYVDADIEENDDLYDTTDYGLRRCINNLKEHTYQKLKTRYNEKVHVENQEDEIFLESFCGFGFEEERREIHRLFLDFERKLAGQRKIYAESLPNVQAYKQGGIITNDVVNELSELYYETDSEKKLHVDHKRELGVILRRQRRWCRNKEMYDDPNRRLLCVSGTAGSGKSHLLYYVAKKVVLKSHVYMFLGTEFSSLEDPVETIAKLMNWGDHEPLKKLNDYLQQDGDKKAVIVIDALNEGTGTHFWAEQLPALKARIEQLPQLKLIVSLRTISNEDQLNNELRRGWIHRVINGFPNREKAVSEFFDNYEINAEVAPYAKIAEFGNPLFLKIFCETYFSQTKDEREKVLRLPIYRKYLTKRNQEVSFAVDVDPKLNVTSDYMSWAAKCSLEQFNGDDIPRKEAYDKAEKVCPYRTWSKNLLRNCLEANLLREYTTSAGDYLDFEFDSMGDYLKAGVLFDDEYDDAKRLKVLEFLYDQMDKEQRERKGTWQKKYNVISAFLSIWNPPVNIWKQKIFMKGKLTSILLSSVHMRNTRVEDNTLTSDIIGQILQKDQDYLAPDLILSNLELYSKGLIDEVHKLLHVKKMAERDLLWTTKVNGLYDGAVYKDLIEQLSPSMDVEVKALLITEIWMLSTSYPYLRAYLIRKVKELLEKHTKMTTDIIEMFYDIDDSYVLSGLYAAVYGVVANVDKADFSREISKLLYECHYGKGGKAPVDLMVRHWTLKIFELAYHQDVTNDTWLKAQPPYTPTEDIFTKMKGENFKDENYFGDTFGGKRIIRSLYHWDFSRYIIGTNSRNESRVFYLSGKAIRLSAIENAIAYLIKHEYKYCENEELGKYDADVPYETGMDNNVERIGKKYQWLGLYQVYAYLCDICKMRINVWSAREEYAKKNYPWYAPIGNYFDPTLSNSDKALAISTEIFNTLPVPSTLEMPVDEWLGNDTQLPPLYFRLKDKKGQEWMVLNAFSIIKESDGEGERNQFVFYNGMFAHRSDYKKLKEWASEMNFYGRWMPEHGGSIDFRWNEYPWADSYLVLGSEGDETFNENGFEMTLAYVAQLQEDYKGMDNEREFLTTVYMPCSDMMYSFNWHTAERGVIRDTDDNIVAINRDNPGEPINALLVRRDLLDNYLRKNKLVLLWALVGEKQFTIGINDFRTTRLTGAAIYVPGKDEMLVQPLRKEPTQPKHERVKFDKEEFPNIPESVLKRMNEMDEEELMKILTEDIKIKKKANKNKRN